MYLAGLCVFLMPSDIANANSGNATLPIISMMFNIQNEAGKDSIAKKFINLAWPITLAMWSIVMLNTAIILRLNIDTFFYHLDTLFF